MDPNVPLYKPEFWEKVQYLDYARQPREIRSGSAGRRVSRGWALPERNRIDRPPRSSFSIRLTIRSGLIPIDGRPRDPIRTRRIPTWFGDSAGRWEGDTLVVESVGFTDESWLGLAWLVSLATTWSVIERVRRVGDVLTWQATVEDPDVLIQPWTMNPRTLKLNPNAKTLLIEDLPCEERDAEHMTSLERG